LSGSQFSKITKIKKEEGAIYITVENGDRFYYSDYNNKTKTAYWIPPGYDYPLSFVENRRAKSLAAGGVGGQEYFENWEPDNVNQDGPDLYFEEQSGIDLLSDLYAPVWAQEQKDGSGIVHVYINYQGSDTNPDPHVKIEGQSVEIYTIIEVILSSRGVYDIIIVKDDSEPTEMNLEDLQDGYLLISGPVNGTFFCPL